MASQKWIAFSMFLVLFTLMKETKLVQADAECVTICEGGRETISCPEGKTINVVYASYGRHDTDTCFSSTASDFDCHYDGTLRVVQRKCQDQTSCRLKAQNLQLLGSPLNDPCHGTRKYLQVTYFCKND